MAQPNKAQIKFIHDSVATFIGCVIMMVDRTEESHEHLMPRSLEICAAADDKPWNYHDLLDLVDAAAADAIALIEEHRVNRYGEEP